MQAASRPANVVMVRNSISDAEYQEVTERFVYSFFLTSPVFNVNVWPWSSDLEPRRRFLLVFGRGRPWLPAGDSYGWCDKVAVRQTNPFHGQGENPCSLGTRPRSLIADESMWRSLKVLVMAGVSIWTHELPVNEHVCDSAPES